MKSILISRPVLAAICLVALRALPADAGSATWTSAPDRGSWDDPTDWNPMTVPNGPSDVATFAASSSTNVFVGPSDEVASIVFSAGASPFTIMEHSGSLTISGAGVINNSGVAQNFVIQPNQQFGSDAIIFFLNGASAGNASYTNYGKVFEAVPVGLMQFYDSATAGSATISNLAGFAGSGSTTFRDTSTAASATISNYPQNPGTNGDDHGYTDFVGNASAGDATITCFGGDAKSPFGPPSGGAVTFADSTTAGTSFIVLDGGTAAGTAGGELTFTDNSTAADMFVIAAAGTGGGLGSTIIFLKGSLGGAARIAVNGTLDLSSHNPPGISTGAVSGNGTVILGANNLTVGAIDTSSTLGGLIEDGPAVGGSLTIHGGRLDLTNANTYTGGTSVTAGALLVDNSTGSATGPGPVAVEEGTLAGQGIVSGAVTIGSGSGQGAFLAPGRQVARVLGNLTALGAVTFASDGTYRCEVRQQRADRLTANGLAINPGAQFSLRLLQHLPPAAGTVLKVINNTSAAPIAGTFANLADGVVLQVEGVKFQASYTGGTGNDLTLTVLP